MVALLRALYRALASYWLAITVLFFLLVLTFLGTIEQVTHGLYAVQSKYFNSLFVLQEVFGIPLLPLPGVYLLLILLFINILLGGLMRFRWRLSRLGVFIAHIGILVLLLAGFVTYRYSSDGHLTLYENDSSADVLSYYDWEIAIAPASGANAFYIPDSQFRDARQGKPVTFHNPALPFDLVVSDYMRNAVLQPAAQDASKAKAVDGLVLTEQAPAREQERNMAGAYLLIKDAKTGAVRDGIVSGYQQQPIRVSAGGASWTIGIQHRQWQLPFSVELIKFTRELHPGTQMPSSFSSDVTVTDPSGRQNFHIAMNKPLRYMGYTLFQASWGPPNAGPNDRLYSTLAVVKNPADQWPLYACVIIAIGLLVHFGYKLINHLRVEARSAA